MNTAGVAGGLQPQLARGIAAQHITVEHAVTHQIPIARRRPFRIEGCAGESPEDVRALMHLHERRKDALARGIQQKRRLAILTCTANGADEMLDQAAGHLRREDHRRFACRQLSRPQSCDSTFAGLAAYGLSRVEIRGVSRCRVPVITLHLLALLRDERAAQGVAGPRVATEKSV